MRAEQGWRRRRRCRCAPGPRAASAGRRCDAPLGPCGPREAGASVGRRPGPAASWPCAGPHRWCGARGARRGRSSGPGRRALTRRAGRRGRGGRRCPRRRRPGGPCPRAGPRPGEGAGAGGRHAPRRRRRTAGPAPAAAASPSSRSAAQTFRRLPRNVVQAPPRRTRPVELDGRAGPVELQVLGRIFFGVGGLALLGLGVAEAGRQGPTSSSAPTSTSSSRSPAAVESRRIGHLGPGVHPAGVEALGHLHEAHAGGGVAGQQRPLDRRRAPPAGQEGEVEVDHGHGARARARRISP